MAFIASLQLNQSPVVGMNFETYVFNSNDVNTGTITPKTIKQIVNIIATPYNAAASAVAATQLFSWVNTSNADPILTVTPGANNCIYVITIIGTT